DALMGYNFSMERATKAAHCFFFIPGRQRDLSSNFSCAMRSSVRCHLYSTVAMSTIPTSSSSSREEGLEVEPRENSAASDLFRKWGCSESDIRTIFLRQPSLEKANLSNLDSKLCLLVRKLGLTSSDLVKIINCRPRFLGYRISQGFDERLDYLQAIFEPRQFLLKAITRNPSLLIYNCKKVVEPVLSSYEKMGVSRKHLIPLLLSRPTLLTRTNMSEEKMEYINRIGVSAKSKMYKYLVSIVGISRMETIHEKVANIEKFGVSNDEVLQLIGRSPMILTLSIDKVQRNMIFVVGTLKLPAKVALDCPYLLYCNLETVLKPRVLLAGKIQDMDLYPQIKGPYMIRALRMTEKRFLAMFVTCHPMDISNELMGYYENAKRVRRLAEASKRTPHKDFPF
ncbi:hypothetical protein Dimus_011215, partial [Dionaea muscipula]